MTTSRSDEMLVGIVALALVPLIVLRIVRGQRTGRLPLYRTYLDRADGGAKFKLLLGLHVLSLLLVVLVAADLLLGIGLRDAL